MQKNKFSMAISLILALTFAVSTIALPTASAQSPKKTYAYIGAIPNPVNVGGETLIHTGITDAITTTYGGFTGLTVTVTKPDGTTETLGPFKTDTTGGTGTVYVPSKVGNYTFQTNFPEQVLGTTKYLASTSEKLTLVVQEEPIAYYPAHPLPTEYWTRPIDPQHRSWYTVSGSWLATPENLYVPYNEGPESAHVLWTRPFTTGGLVGGDVGMADSMNQGPVGFETGDAYQGKWSSRFIIAGVLIYTHHTSIRPLVYTAVNLRTGEVLWERTFLDNRTIGLAQTFYWQSYNYMGTYSYLWVTTTSITNNWVAFDLFDGSMRINLTNIPTGTNIIGERGEIYRYSISTATGRMTLWNMSALISMEGSFLGPGPVTYNASATLANGSLTAAAQRAYSLNFTFEAGLPGSVTRVYLKDRIIGGRINSTAVDLWGISLKPGQEGQTLFKNTWKAPAEWAEGNLTLSGFAGGWVGWSLEDKVGVMYIKETRQHYAFSLDTGQYLWGPTEPQHYLDAIDDSVDDCRNIAFGKFYSASVGGIVYCYDAKTGKLLWTYEAEDPYTEILWSNNWWLKPMFFTDGKAYFGHTEHSANMPMPRGAPFICLNATTGELIWRVNGMFRQTRWGGRGILGDSVIATMDTYDQQVWAIGKGPSATTVTAPDMGVPFGSSVMIRGTVMDMSPGTKSDRLMLRFPNGVPAVSDASMSDWMLYVYKQYERPMNASGVDVTISVLDANGNYRTIGKTTSSTDGVFNFAWTPDIPGEFKVYASFSGSAGYYPSSAETAFIVDKAPEPEPVIEPEVKPTIADLYLLPGIAAIIATIVIVGAVIVLMLRKRQ